MGEAHGWLFEPTFNRSIKLRQADPRITSDAGTPLLREVDHRMGLTTDMAASLTDGRDPRYTRYTQTELLRQHLYALALGYAHQDDQDALAHDVAMKLSVWDRPGKQVLQERLASQPSDWRLVECLSSQSPQHLPAARPRPGTWRRSRTEPCKGVIQYSTSSYAAPSGLCVPRGLVPRAMPWAGICQPFRLADLVFTPLGRPALTAY